MYKTLISGVVPHFRRRLLINPEEHPMLIAEPSTNTAQQREKYVHALYLICLVFIALSHRAVLLVSYLFTVMNS